MEAVKILEKGNNKIDWEYDEEGDVLYLSIGKPRRLWVWISLKV